MGKKVRHNQFIVAYEDLEQHKDKKVEDYIEIAKRAKLYKSYYNHSGLREDIWCEALEIPKSVHRNFLKTATLVPDNILIEAKEIRKSMRNAITRVRRRNNEKRKERLLDSIS